MTATVKALLDNIKTALTAIYGERLKGVYLYGSYARGEADPESDFDVLVVLDDFEHYGAEVDRTGKSSSDLSLEYDVSISKVFLREQDWREGDTPFLLNVREEAISA